MNIDDLKELLDKAKAGGAKVEVIDHTPNGAPGGLAGLAQLLNRPAPGKRPPAEVQLMEIKQYLDQYQTNRFKVGDIVTPKKSSILRGSGEPFIVIEVNENPQPFHVVGSESSAPDFGARFNLRVCGYSDDGQHILCWWNESMHYEYWNPETSGQA